MTDRRVVVPKTTAPNPTGGTSGAGGSSTKSWLCVGDGSHTPSSGAFESVAFDGISAVVGSNIAWDDGAPTDIVIERDMSVHVAFSALAGGANRALVDMQINLIRGVSDHEGVFTELKPFGTHDPSFTTDGVFLGFTYPSHPVLAGDIIRMEVRSTDGAFALTFDDCTMIVAEA